MPTLTQLEYILAVDQHRHFGKAAAACHISQPTLSQQISKLEDHLGIIIFDRLQKPVIPTPAGQNFIQQTRVVLREHQRLLEGIKKKPDGLSGEFRLGVIPTIAPYLAPLFLESFSKAYPDIELFIEELKTESILSELEKDHLDGAVMATPLVQGNFKQHPLYYEPFYLYVSENHPLARKKMIKESDLDGSQIWLLKDGHCFKDQVIRFCSIDPDADTVFRNVHFQSGNLDTLKYLVQKSYGYTLIPKLMTTFLGASELKEHVRPFVSPAPTREISFVYRRDHWKLEIIDALKKNIQSALPKDVSKSKQKDHLVLELC